MKKNRVYIVSSLLARISGNCKFWLIALPAVTMLAQAPAAYAHAESVAVEQDYRRRVESVTSDTEYQVAMSPNGGWTAMIEEYQ